MRIAKTHKMIVSLVALVVISTVLSAFLAAVSIINSPYYKSSQLIKAIEKKDHDKLETLLIDGTDPNYPESRISKLNEILEYVPRVPIKVAIKNDDLKSVEILLKYGATVSCIDGTGWSPLRTALFQISDNTIEIVNLLLENGADPFKNEGNCNAFYAVASDSRENAVLLIDLLLNYCNETPISIKNKSGETKSLATYAARIGRNPNMVKFLLENGDCLDESWEGESLYVWCITNGYLELAELIIQQKNSYEKNIEFRYSY